MARSSSSRNIPQPEYCAALPFRGCFGIFQSGRVDSNRCVAHCLVRDRRRRRASSQGMTRGLAGSWVLRGETSAFRGHRLLRPRTGGDRRRPQLHRRAGGVHRKRAVLRRAYEWRECLRPWPRCAGESLPTSGFSPRRIRAAPNCYAAPPVHSNPPATAPPTSRLPAAIPRPPDDSASANRQRRVDSGSPERCA